MAKAKKVQAPNGTPTVETVKLSHLNSETSDVFPTTQALRILTMKNSAWKVADKDWTFDGKELRKTDGAAEEPSKD